MKLQKTYSVFELLGKVPDRILAGICNVDVKEVVRTREQQHTSEYRAFLSPAKPIFTSLGKFPRVDDVTFLQAVQRHGGSTFGFSRGKKIRKFDFESIFYYYLENPELTLVELSRLFPAPIGAVRGWMAQHGLNELRRFNSQEEL